ncbi:MAG: multidrug transporter subunit MdtD [Lautropia sp.]|nr:multidrug transporter subunit MdtD [Lautropia sp.]
MTAISPSAPAIQVKPLLWLVAIGFFMQTLDGTIVNTALPSMAAALGESPLSMQAVVVSYMLTMAAVIPASGWLAERFGTRNVFCLAICLFTLGSAACALANSLSQLVAARILQGLGAAMLFPVGRLAILSHVPREQFLAAMSFVAIPGLVGPLIGPSLGGWLVEHASWQWIFLINLPIGLLGALATRRFMPNLRRTNVGRFDLAGFLMLILAMTALSLALDGLGTLGWGRLAVAVLIVAGLAALAAYWLHASRIPHPLFPPSLFSVPSYRVGILGNLFARIGSGAMPYLMPLLLQLAMGFSPAEAGMMLLPVALASIGAKRAITSIITRHGYRRVLIVNTLLLGTLLACIALMTPDQPLWLRTTQLACFGAINSTQFTAMNTVTLKDLGPEQAGSGNSLFSMVQMLGMSLGVSCAAALLHVFSAMTQSQPEDGNLLAFRATFVLIGLLTAASAAIFWQLPDDRPKTPAV